MSLPMLPGESADASTSANVLGIARGRAPGRAVKQKEFERPNRSRSGALTASYFLRARAALSLCSRRLPSRADRTRQPIRTPMEASAPLVLIVDRDDDSRDIFRTALEWGGYRVMEATEPDEALRICREQRPGLVVGDLPLDTAHGHGFVDRLRADPELDATPVIVVTARAMRSEVRVANRLGDVVLLKPLVPARLMEEVERLVGPATGNGGAGQPLPAT